MKIIHTNNEKLKKDLSIHILSDIHYVPKANLDFLYHQIDVLEKTPCDYVFILGDIINDSKYDIEDLKIVDPQYIFCPVDFKDNIMRNRELKELTAVKNGNVFEVEEKLARRNGRSIISFATTIAGIVYPELLEESTTVSTAMDPDEIADDKNEVLYKLGDSGDDIESFQKRLSQLGYYKGEITRVFDTATQEAIIYFQEVHKVEVTGVMDELTLEMLSGENVKEAPDKENDPQDLENPVGDLPVVDAEPEE